MKRHAKEPSAGSTDGSGSSRAPFRRASVTRASSDAKGSGAPSWRRVPIVSILGLVAIALLAFGAAGASAADPTVTINSPTAEYTTAQVSGTVNPQGEGAYYEIEISTDQVNWSGFSFEHAVGDPGDNPVSNEFTGLTPGTKYFFRIVAGHYSEEVGGLNPPVISPEVSVTTKPVAPPAVTLDPITTFTSSTAKISGTVSANAPGPLNAAGEAAYETEWHFECSPACPGLPSGVIKAGEASQVISTEAIRLEANQLYEVKLVASNKGGTTAPVRTFHTPLILPAVKSAPGASDGKGGYNLQGIVTPFNSEVTDCHFEYGPTAAYVFVAPCSPSPGSKNLPVVVEAHVTGLTPDATYHFQVVATNGAGTVASGDRIFVPTLAPSQPPCPNDTVRAENNSLALPECRAYEQVSAPNKSGYPAEIIGYFGGASVAYRSNASNINNSGQGYPGRNLYATNRTNSGWETIPNLNHANGSLFSGPEAVFGPRSPDLYSEDLQSSMWFLEPGGLSNSNKRAYLRKPDGSFTLIGNGIPGQGSSYLPEANIAGASTDLSHLVFNGQAPPSSPIYGPGMYEFVGTGNDLPRRVDVDNSGDPISGCGPVNVTPGGAYGYAVSRDGSVITFTAIGGCGLGDSPAANEIWARVNGTTSYDLSKSRCTRTSGDPGGACNAPAPAYFAGASTDGSHVYFITTQQLVNGDTDQANDVYVADVPTPSNPIPAATLAEISGTAGGGKVEQFDSGSPYHPETYGQVVSDDGSTIYFVAQGVLAGNKDAFEETAVAGDHNLYVWRRDAAHPAGQIKFIGRLLNNDLFEGYGSVAKRPQTTPDGRYLILATASPLVPTDSDNAVDIYRYDAAAGVMTRASVNTFGVGGNADGFDASINVGEVEIRRRHSHPAVSDDGQLIVFATSEALSSLDGNDESDVYLWKDGRVSLLSTGSVRGGSRAAFIAGSGQDIYFETLAALSPSDGDSTLDTYDARVGGGFSFVEPAGCSGEACQDPASAPAGVPNPATDHAPFPDPRQQPKTCPKGKVAKKGKCVKKPKNHHKKKAKRAARGHHGGAK